MVPRINYGSDLNSSSMTVPRRTKSLSLAPARPADRTELSGIRIHFLEKNDQMMYLWGYFQHMREFKACKIVLHHKGH